jgi:hypothetical protein
MKPCDLVDRCEMATGNLFINEPRQVWTIGPMSPGSLESLVPLETVSEVSTRLGTMKPG